MKRFRGRRWGICLLVCLTLFACKSWRQFWQAGEEPATGTYEYWVKYIGKDKTDQVIAEIQPGTITRVTVTVQLRNMT